MILKKYSYNKELFLCGINYESVPWHSHHFNLDLNEELLRGIYHEYLGVVITGTSRNIEYCSCWIVIYIDGNIFLVSSVVRTK